jgi:hypothetical protein
MFSLKIRYTHCLIIIIIIILLSNKHPYMFVTRKKTYCKIPRILRLCKACNKIEDEEHFILECTINSKLRTDLFAILANENPNFMVNCM